MPIMKNTSMQSPKSNETKNEKKTEKKILGQNQREICSFFLKQKCNKGTECKFSHENPMPTPTPRTITVSFKGPCFNYFGTNGKVKETCEYGVRCFNSHFPIPCQYGVECRKNDCIFTHPEGWVQRIELMEVQKRMGEVKKQ